MCSNVSSEIETSYFFEGISEGLLPTLSLTEESLLYFLSATSIPVFLSYPASIPKYSFGFFIKSSTLQLKQPISITEEYFKDFNSY